eukprot:TRINITY_DN122405_c0_g1_i1.p1 TRINITY_DN122405_c0_g1~~TRINITY_DN122405_c0_g1_i1.p1  ORF type:complete len:485 (+),score=55.57 TRINITY_DN122405_c0_g1_i1:62-1456(+)
MVLDNISVRVVDWTLLAVMLWRLTTLKCCSCCSNLLQRLLHMLPMPIPRLLQYDTMLCMFLVVTCLWHQWLWAYWFWYETNFLSIDRLLQDMQKIESVADRTLIADVLHSSMWPVCRMLVLFLLPLIQLFTTFMVLMHIIGDAPLSSAPTLPGMLSAEQDLRIIVLSMPAIFTSMAIQGMFRVMALVANVVADLDLIVPPRLCAHCNNTILVNLAERMCLWEVEEASAFRAYHAGIELAVLYELFTVFCYCNYSVRLVSIPHEAVADIEVVYSSLLKITKQTVYAFCILGAARTGCQMVQTVFLQPTHDCTFHMEKEFADMLARLSIHREDVKRWVQTFMTVSNWLFTCTSVLCLVNFDVAGLSEVERALPNANKKFMGTRILVSLVTVQHSVLLQLTDSGYVNKFEAALLTCGLLVIECLGTAVFHLVAWSERVQSAFSLASTGPREGLLAEGYESMDLPKLE